MDLDMVFGRAASLVLPLFVAACGSALPVPRAEMEAAAAPDCAVLSRRIASVHDALDNPAAPPADATSSRRVLDGAERDLRAMAASDGSPRELVTAYADLLRDLVDFIDRARASRAALIRQAETLHTATRPAVAAFDKHCPRDHDEASMSDCGRVRALFEARRHEPDCAQCIDRLGDQLHAIAVRDTEVARLKPDLVQALRNEARNELAFGSARATSERDLEVLAAREAELRRRGHRACPAVELAEVVSPSAGPPGRPTM